VAPATGSRRTGKTDRAGFPLSSGKYLRRFAMPPQHPAKPLVRTTLYRIAAGVTVIVALSGAVTYHLLYREIEQGALERLREYAVQRARYHGSHFSLVRELHRVVRQEFVQRYAEPMPEAERRFDALMRRYPDGAFRNSPEFSDVERYSTGWIHQRVRPDPEFKRRWMLFFDLSEKFARTFTIRFPNFYIMHASEPANMGYDDPEKSNHVHWAESTPADYALDRREYFYIAGPVHNPSRETVWGGTYYEPAYRKILVPALTPVYVGGRHIATIGTDDLLDDLEASILHSDIPGASHTVFRGDDGRLMIDPSYMARIVGSYNGLYIREAHDRRLDALLALARESANLPRYGYDPAIDQYYAISRLPDMGWYFASTMPGQLIRTQAFQAVQWVLWTGLASLALLLASLAAILRRQIGQPLRQLLAAIQSVGAGAAPAVPKAAIDDEFGRLAGAFNDMVRKVSERDAALRVEKERFRALIEHAADIIGVIDAEGTVLYVSPSVKTVLDWPPEAYLGKDLSEIVHADDAAMLREVLDHAVKQPGRAIARFEYRVRHRDGTWRTLEATGTNQLANPSVRGIVVNGRDITEVKQAEAEIARQREALYQREKLAAMGSLLAGVAHELNNPLSIVVGRAIMLEEGAQDPATRAAAQKIHAAAERCARIVKTFLAMARRHPPQYTAVRVSRIVEASLDMLGYSLRTGGVEVDFCPSEDLPEIAADADQLHQVFINLIVNAQQALADRTGPRRLRIASAHDPDRHEVRVEVADNGPGIPEDIRSRIFDPYFTTKPIGSGTGVGLSVSLGIVEAHGGRLAVACPPEGGTVFTIHLPVQAAKNAAANSAEPAPPGGRKRLLIVDDEPEVGALLADILDPARHCIDIAASGKEALERIERNGGYDAVLTDLRMPEMDGPALYREIRTRWPDLARRVAFVTGDTLSPQVCRLLEDSRCPVIEKPFVPGEVRRVVAAIGRNGKD
jgi:PAS domain S-box-containing protein